MIFSSQPSSSSLTIIRKTEHSYPEQSLFCTIDRIPQIIHVMMKANPTATLEMIQKTLIYLIDVQYRTGQLSTQDSNELHEWIEANAKEIYESNRESMCCFECVTFFG